MSDERRLTIPRTRPVGLSLPSTHHSLLIVLLCASVALPSRAGKVTSVQEFTRLLDGRLDCGVQQKSFCTHYSVSGVVKTKRLGIEQLCLHYNRRTSVLSPALLTLSFRDDEKRADAFEALRVSPTCIEEKCAVGKGRLWYVSPDVMYYEFQASTSEAFGTASLSVPATSPAYERELTWDPGTHTLLLETRLPRTDARDPDESFPVACAVRLPPRCGPFALGEARKPADTAWEWRDSGEVTLSTQLPPLRAIGALIAVGVGDGAANAVEKLNAVGEMNGEKAEAVTQLWLKEALGELSFKRVPEDLRLPYALSAYSLISNAKTPHGLFGKRIACFPNRGTYASHYLWDSCFQSLGLSFFNRRIAADGLRILVENQEADGKVPQFVCATWHRPGASQPPLIGWAAWRLDEEFGDEQLLKDIYQPLCRFVNWWFEKRDEDRDGLVEYSEALESGWDNSPRFDDGMIEPVELNSFLYREMTVLSKTAALMNRPDESDRWSRRADELGKRIREGLCDEQDGIFYDRLFDSHKFVRIQTPASFAPLWCAVPIERESAKKMIERYLLNPDCFYGDYPFPTVAYNHPKCEPAHWWRGPIWPNMAWMCAEVLRSYGYDKEWRAAAERLVKMMAQGGEPHELYDCKTGKPLGAPQLGWSCSLFMQLVQDLREPPGH